MSEDRPPAPTLRPTPARLCAASCSWLLCSPPASPADTRVKRFADRLMPRPGWPAVVYFATVAIAVGVAAQLPAVPRLTFTGVASLAGGAWCAVNFWRCRHAHCLVTGAGWLALGGLALVGAVQGRSVLAGTERLLFVAVLGLGIVFEAVIYLARGSVSLGQAPEPRRGREHVHQGADPQ